MYAYLWVSVEIGMILDSWGILAYPGRGKRRRGRLGFEPVCVDMCMCNVPRERVQCRSVKRGRAIMRSEVLFCGGTSAYLGT